MDTSISCFTTLLLLMFTGNGQTARSFTNPMDMYQRMNLLPSFTGSMFFSPHEMSNSHTEMSVPGQYMPQNRSPTRAAHQSSSPNYFKKQPKTILVDSGDQSPVNLVFRSASTRLNVMQDHSTQSQNKVLQMQTHEEPVKLVLNITKPVIQEVNELILPYRNIKQEIRPVKEYIETTVMKKNSYPGSERSNEENTGYATHGASSEDHYEQQASFDRKPPVSGPNDSPPMASSPSPTTTTHNQDLSQIKRYVNYIKSQDATQGLVNRNHRSDQRYQQVKSSNQFNQASPSTLDLADQINLSPTVLSDKLAYVSLKPDTKQYTVNQEHEAQANMVRYSSPPLNSALLYLADWQDPYQESRARHTVSQQSASLPSVDPSAPEPTNSTTTPQS